MERVTIEARSLSVVIGSKTLLDDVSFTVQRGEVLALVGPNGAGKSTLLRAVSGDIAPTSGTVHLDGKETSAYNHRELAMRRAVLPQQTFLQFAFTAREIVEMGRGARTGRLERERDDDVIAEAMARTETEELADRTFPTLSGGEQARVTLARVLSQEAPILLLDEPTAALDLSHQQMVMEIARQLAAEGGTVLAILHDLNLAAAYADRLAILHHGKLSAFAEPWEALDPALLSEAFDCPIAVARHPMRNCPLVLPLPRNAAHQSLAGQELTITSPMNPAR
ncbi:heme ABC transporter ATP-binding protein [soil metagenome]